MMKKWVFLLTFLFVTDVFSSSPTPGGAATLTACCYKGNITDTEACCEGHWGNSESVSMRSTSAGTQCCFDSNVGAPFAHYENQYGQKNVLGGTIITKVCCESQDKKGAAPGNYQAWPEPSTNGGHVCCIKDTWKWWSTGSNNERCCKHQGGKKVNNRCCIGAYDIEKKGHSRTCCKDVGGIFYNGVCCVSEESSQKKADQIEQKIEGGEVKVEKSGAGPCEECCKNAHGKWMGSYCCGTWGVKMPDGTCKAKTSDDEDVPS